MRTSDYLTLVLNRPAATTTPPVTPATYTFNQQNTTYTNAMGSDGYSWSQAGYPGGPLVKDSFGKFIAISENEVGNHKFTYSNDGGTTWVDSTLEMAFLTRGSIAYNPLDDKLEVLWEAQLTTDGILYRRYSITRDGSNNITGFTALGTGYAQLDFQSTGTMEYKHPIILWLNIGVHGRVIVAWSAYNSGVGSEIRAARLAIANNPTTDMDPESFFNIGISSATTIGNGPNTASYSCLFSSTDPVPHAAILRLTNSDLLIVYHDGPVVNSSMAGNWKFRRATWNGGTGTWTALTAATTIMALKRTGTDAGYNAKGELISKIVEDGSNNAFIGLPSWKDNTNGDTWSIVRIASDNTVTIQDVYSAGGAHVYAPTGDIVYDSGSGKVATSYIDTVHQYIYMGSYLGSDLTVSRTPELAFDGAPVDIPLLSTGIITNKITVLFRDTIVSYHGWFGTVENFF